MNTTENKTGYISLLAAAAIGEGQRVYVSAAKTVNVAGVTDPAIGVATAACASGDYCPIKLFTAPGTFLVKAAAGVVAGAQLYPAATGTVDDAGTTKINLVALEAATAANDLIEAAPCMLGA